MNGLNFHHTKLDYLPIKKLINKEGPIDYKIAKENE
jgi:hypothetical protein